MPRKNKSGNRHRPHKPDLPQWVLDEENICIKTVAKDAYVAKAHADEQGANSEPNCEGVYNAAMKSLEKLEDEDLSVSVRTHHGNRAARKFWEAKVCGREKRVARERLARLRK